MAIEQLAQAIDQQEWIDPVVDPLQKSVKTALRSAGPLKDFLHGVWLGHPLHPALVSVPVGAWTTALAFDALESMTSRRELRAGADAAVGLGLLGAVASAATGLADWSEIDARAKKIGALHGALNVAATALYATSWVLRRRKKQRSTAVALSMIGFAIANTSAWIGGHLSFGEQIGVDHTATPDAGQPEKFTRVMKESELEEDTPTRVDAGDAAILLVKRGDRIFAISHTCPHLGGPLSEGKLVGDAIECPWHQSQLALDDGHVVAGPTCYPARVYETRVRSGNIEVRAKR
jgi:nitrite reductase/ring-hydroxylating ferredoxin subunit/uncharacterized membrane protein